MVSAPVAQLDRASDYESAGWGFESLQARTIYFVEDIAKDQRKTY